MKEFLQMGDYGAFVWSAFGIVTLVLIGNVILARRHWQAVVTRNRRRIRSRT